MRTRRPSLLTAQSCQDLVAGEKQVTDSHSPARDAGSSSPQSLNLASPQLTTQSHGIDSTLLTTPSQSIDWIPLTTESQQSPALNHINYEAFEEFMLYFTQDTRLISTAWIPAAPFADNKFVFHSNCNDVQGFFSDHSRVLHSLSPPHALLVTENLFHNIKVYFENSC